MIAFFAVSMAAQAQQQVIPVWTGAAPGSENWTQKEETTVFPGHPTGGSLVRNVTQPTLTVFLPDPSIAKWDCGGGVPRRGIPFSLLE